VNATHIIAVYIHRNQMKVWEAEQETIQAQKEKEQAMVSIAPAQLASTMPWWLCHAACKYDPRDCTDGPLLLQAEFEAEQEYMKTLSYLSEEQQQKYRDRYTCCTLAGCTQAI
jgi:hypothetical protein